MPQNKTCEKCQNNGQKYLSSSLPCQVQSLPTRFTLIVTRKFQKFVKLIARAIENLVPKRFLVYWTISAPVENINLQLKNAKVLPLSWDFWLFGCFCLYVNYVWLTVLWQALVEATTTTTTTMGTSPRFCRGGGLGLWCVYFFRWGRGRGDCGFGSVGERVTR